MVCVVILSLKIPQIFSSMKENAFSHPYKHFLRLFSFSKMQNTARMRPCCSRLRPSRRLPLAVPISRRVYMRNFPNRIAVFGQPTAVAVFFTGQQMSVSAIFIIQYPGKFLWFFGRPVFSIGFAGSELKYPG